MAKTGRELIKLESTAGTGYFYVTSKNRRTMTEKLKKKMFDPRAARPDGRKGMHVLFEEKKIK